MSTGLVSFAMWSGAMIAALLCRTSSRPKRSTVVEMRFSTEVTSPASNWIPTAASPMSAATFSARSPSMSPTPTLAPSAASRRAVAAPMPDPPPVMTATLPSKRLSSGIAVAPLSSAELACDGADDGVRRAGGLEALGCRDLAAGDLDDEVAVDQGRLALGERQRRSEAAERLVLQRVETLLDRCRGDIALRGSRHGCLEQLAGCPSSGRDLALGAPDTGCVLGLRLLVLLGGRRRGVGEGEVALGRHRPVHGLLLGPGLGHRSARCKQRRRDALVPAGLGDLERDGGGT